MAARCREPERYYLGVLVFPKDADGWVRVVADHMVPTTEVSPGTLRRGPPSTPGGRKIDLDDENDVLRREDSRRGRPLPTAKALLPWSARVPQASRRQGAGCRRPHGPVYEWVDRDAASPAAFASGGSAWSETAETAAAASAR